MWVPRCIVAAISMLVLTATPAVVEGTCHCAEVCPSYEHCWTPGRGCIGDNFPEYMIDHPGSCNGYCICNVFGCHCDGCERHPGDCGWTQQKHALMDEEEEDGCADFRYITSLSLEGKRDFLAEKYCLEDGKVVVKNIFEILRNEVLRKLDGSVLTCALFNESYGDVSHLKLCEDKQPAAVSLLTSSSTGNTNGGHSFVLVVVGLLGAAMIFMKVVQRRRRVLLRRNEYSNPDDEL